MARLFKDKAFLAGFLFLLTMVVYSLGNTILNKGEIYQTVLSYDKEGNFIGAPPYPPSIQHPFGTDVDGYDMLAMVMQGSQYTIGIALLITIIRLGGSFVLGGFISTYLPGRLGFFRALAEPFSLIPQVIVAYFLLSNVLIMPPEGFKDPFWHRALFEILILSFLALPTLTINIAEVMKGYWNQDFVTCSKTLGASRFYIFRKHICSLYKEDSILLFIQQFIQVLTILAHLGVLNLFFGGTFIDYSGESPPKTISYEWSGLIGDYYPLRGHYPWISFTVIFFFALTIFALNIMLSAVERVFSMPEIKGKPTSFYGGFKKKNKKPIDESM